MISNYTAGYDEVGWGSIAGPLVVAGVIMPDGVEIGPLIKDSKKFSSDVLRKKAYDHIIENYDYSYGVIHVENVASAILNTFPHTRYSNWGEALHSSLGQLVTHMTIWKFPKNANVRLVVDGNSTHGIPGLTAIPKADSTVASVAAASIVAKVIHDDYMVQLQNRTKVDYGWAANKGYGTPEHLRAMTEHGVTDQHRFNIQKVMDAYKLKGYTC